MKFVTTFTVFLASTGMASAVNLFTPGDFAIAVADPTFDSSYPGAEAPANLIDQDSASKYLNFGQENSGIIITPASGSSTIGSLGFTTANDSQERDPASFLLYGTNDAITSSDNSQGGSETWSLISTSTVTLPAARGASGTFVDIGAAMAFTSYRMVFDSLQDGGAANSMQLAELQAYTGFLGAGSTVFAPGDPIIAIDVDPPTANSSYPGGEAPANAIDGDKLSTKYLNFSGSGTGLIVTPSVGSTIAESFVLTSGNDAPGRDPVDYSVYGTNDAITSADNSGGADENWILIQSGTLTPPGAFNTDYATENLTNSAAYSSYKFIVDANAGDNLLQFNEIQFDGQVVPEPSSGLLALLSMTPLILRRRRK